MTIPTVNIHEAKTHLSKLIEEAIHGQPFIIAKAGKPLVMVTALSRKNKTICRLGFMEGQITVPADFDRMGSQDIEDMFGGNL